MKHVVKSHSLVGAVIHHYSCTFIAEYDDLIAFARLIIAAHEEAMHR